MKLYGHPRTASFAGEATLAMVGAEAEIVDIDKAGGQHLGADFQALNPKGRIPILILPSGQVMTETAATVLHLADMYPDAGLAPAPGSDARARMLRWMQFATLDIYEPDLRYVYSARYTDDPACIDGVKAAALKQWDRGFEVLDAALGETEGPYLLGAEPCAADLYFPMFVCWYVDTPALLARSPNLARLGKAVRALAPLDAAFKRHRMDEFDDD